MTTAAREMVFACKLEQLREQQCVVVRGADRPIAIFFNDGEVRAVDNRCPHMGFPLSKGSVSNGLITCHWHHARFDAASGCTFDLWADDVPAFDVETRADEVWVSPIPRRQDPVEHGLRRLREGMEQNIGLVQAKAILTLRSAKIGYGQILRESALFGTRMRDDWSAGLTILAAMGNLLPHLDEETAFLAVWQGVSRVAEDCAGEAPRHERAALATREISADRLDKWMCYWTQVRHRDGAERTMMTAIESELPRQEVATLLFTAATERFFADTGHTLDFCSKALELLDLIGWEHAGQVLPSVVGQMVRARGGEEMNSWRHPVDLVPVVRSAQERLPSLFEQAARQPWTAEAQLAEEILGDDPQQIIQSIEQAILDGATPPQLGKSLAYAAVMRVARFGTSNELGDWISALHTFTYCNAVHQFLKRCPEPRLVRAVLHGAMAVYLDRFLNIPPAPLPDEKAELGTPAAPEELMEELFNALDRQGRVRQAAQITSRYLAWEHPTEKLLHALCTAVVREDADFHTFQMVEAGIRQFFEWEAGTAERRNIAVAMARYIGAHSPTQRSRLQTAKIALRLHRGESVYEQDEA